MVKMGLILRLFTLVTLRTAECSYDGLGAMSQGQQLSKTSERISRSVYVPYRGSVPNLFLSARSDKKLYLEREECAMKASRDVYDIWSSNECYVARLTAPVCRDEISNDTGYMIKESFLTDGSPDDDSELSLAGQVRFVSSNHIIAFRVMTPTIPEFPEFTTEIAYHPPSLKYEKSIHEGKIFVLPKLGGVVTIDDSILVDPSCHTNNSCGVAFLTASVEVFNTPHVALDQYCGQTIHLNDTPVLNVFSHAGIGCKFFSDVYTTPNCELTITSPSAITANVTLVNFRKTTCEGFELKFVTSTCTVDVCKENAPTVFNSSEGKMQIKLTGSTSENWLRYGFIIRLERVTKTSSQCSSDNSVQGATDDFPQVSAAAPAESPTNSPVQNPTDGSEVDLPEALLESSSSTEFIGDPAESFESVSPSGSPKRPTYPQHLRLLLALGIEL